jgi:hypothetical protein
MSDQYLSDRQRIARTLMQMDVNEPAPGQQAGVLEALGIVAPFGMAGRGAAGAASAVRQLMTRPKPYTPIPRSPGFTPMDVSAAREVPPEVTMNALRFIINGGR